jgi:hypothetical protein
LTVGMFKMFKMLNMFKLLKLFKVLGMIGMRQGAAGRPPVVAILNGENTPSISNYRSDRTLRTDQTI